MANKAYQGIAENSKASESAKGGMKNVDGREKGSEWNSDKSVDASFKSVGVEPNDGLKQLPQISGDLV